MDALVVVHVENRYLDYRHDYQEAFKKRIRFDRIARVAGDFLKRGERVYFLAESAESPDSDRIYPALRGLFPGMVFVESDIHSRQFLGTKKRLMEENTRKISVAGVSYDYCLTDLQGLLSGEGSPYIRKEEYEDAGKGLGWTEDVFEEVFQKRLDSSVYGYLTDK